jgi:periplasmic protein TonB
MSNNIYLLKNTIDDVVFEHRNQQYGAYWLRTHYNEHMAKGIFVAFLSVFIVFCLPSIFAYFSKPMRIEEICNDYTDVNITIYQKLPEPVKHIEQPKSIKAPLLDIVKNVSPIIVIDEKTDEEKHPFKNNESGTTNIVENSDGSVLSIESGTKNGATIIKAPSKDTTQVVVATYQVDEKPMFPNGEAALLKYLSENIKYPALARENGIEGKVILSFIISKIGSIEDIKVLRGIGAGCDEEAIKVIKKMPIWLPGKIKGKPVKVKFTLPIWYHLSK